MKIIDSIVKKERKDNLISYSFEVNNERFLVHYIYGNKPKFELFHNDSLIGFSDQLKNRFEFTVNTEYETFNLIIWMEYNIYSIYIGKLNGVGVEVNGNPVQHTLADSEVYVKNGRSGFYILLLIFGLKSAFTYYQVFKESASHLISFISSFIYVIPLFIVILLTINYKRWTKFALITGAIIASLEFIDYALALPDTISSMSASTSITLLLWAVIRVSVLCMFYNAFKMKKNSGIKIANADHSIK
jgi:hypothetical protein